MLTFLHSCLTGRTCRSRRIIVFGTYHGASVMILRTLDQNLSRISILDFDAVPHSCTPLVHMGFRISLYTSSLFPRDNCDKGKHETGGFVDESVYSFQDRVTAKHYMTVLEISMDCGFIRILLRAVTLSSIYYFNFI